MPDINGIPYVESTDLVSAYPAVSLALAQELDDQLASKLNAEWEFLTMLRDEGRKVTDNFLRKHGPDVGKTSTYVIEKLLEGV